MADFKSEFPDFPVETMPALPADGDFIDTSWHNNTCPSITSDKLGLHIWIDYADVSLREYGAGPRFIVEKQDHGIETGQLVLETDDWNAVLGVIALIDSDGAILRWQLPKAMVDAVIASGLARLSDTDDCLIHRDSREVDGGGYTLSS